MIWRWPDRLVAFTYPSPELLLCLNLPHEDHQLWGPFRQFLSSTIKLGVQLSCDSRCVFSICLLIDCCCSVTKWYPTLCDPMDCSTPGFPVLHYLSEFAQIHVHWDIYLIFCHPLLLLPSIFLSIRIFSNESALCIRWPKYWSFSFSISPSNEYSGLNSFRINWFDRVLVQGTLKSLLQHHSSKASILQHSAFFMVQLSHPYMTTRKTIALTRWTFVGKVMSLLFNMLSRFVIAFLPRSKCLLISSLQLPSAVTLEPKKRKFVTA